MTLIATVLMMILLVNYKTFRYALQGLFDRLKGRGILLEFGFEEIEGSNAWVARQVVPVSWILSSHEETSMAMALREARRAKGGIAPIGISNRLTSLTISYYILVFLVYWY